VKSQLTTLEDNATFLDLQNRFKSPQSRPFTRLLFTVRWEDDNCRHAPWWS